MSIQGRFGIPGIPIRALEHTKQLQCATASSGDGVGEADGAHSTAGGYNEAEQGLDGVSPIRTGDLGDVCWEGSVWEVLFDHHGEFGADDRRSAS